jgi:hypothetical protein
MQSRPRRTGTPGATAVREVDNPGHRVVAEGEAPRNGSRGECDRRDDRSAQVLPGIASRHALRRIPKL